MPKISPWVGAHLGDIVGNAQTCRRGGLTKNTRWHSQLGSSTSLPGINKLNVSRKRAAAMRPVATSTVASCWCSICRQAAVCWSRRWPSFRRGLTCSPGFPPSAGRRSPSTSGRESTCSPPSTTSTSSPVSCSSADRCSLARAKTARFRPRDNSIISQ